MKGDLTQLLGAATEDVEYLFDDSITALDQRDQGVRVSFERAEPRTFDLVVGADGLHSRVRSLAFGAESRFRLGYYVAIFSLGGPSGPEGDLGRDGWTRLYNEPGKLAGIYPARRTYSAKAIFGFASRDVHHIADVDQQKRLLAAEFAGNAWQVPRLRRDLGEADDLYSARTIPHRDYDGVRPRWPTTDGRTRCCPRVRHHRVRRCPAGPVAAH